MDKNDLLDAYVLGRCTEVQIKEVKTLMKSDPDIAQQIAIRRDLIAVAKQQDQIAFKSWINTLPTSNPKRSLYRWIPRTAAALLGLVLLTYIFTRPDNADPQQLFAAHFEPYRNVVQPIVRGSLPDQSIENQALDAYERKDYETAIALFESIPEDSRSDHIVLFMSNAYLAMSRTEQALVVLERPVTDSLKGIFTWYRALAQIQAEQIDNAAATLEQISKTKTFKHQEAAAILEKIKP